MKRFLSVVCGVLFCLSLSGQTNVLPTLVLDKIEATIDLPLTLDVQLTDTNGDPIDLEIMNLPDWLKMTKNVVFEASTIMDLSRSSEATTTVDGDFSTATSWGVSSIATDSVGKYYFGESLRLRELIDGQVVTLMAYEDYPDFNFRYTINKVRYYQGSLFFNTGSRIGKFNLSDKTLVTLAGSDQGEQGDANGQGTNARFNFIIDFISDRQGGWFVADRGAYKVKHISSEGLVTTLAGSGVSGSDDGSAQTSSFSSLQSLKLNDSGNPVVLDGRSERLIANGEVSTILPTENTEGFLRSSDNFYLDDFGNHFHFDDRELLVYDNAGVLIKELSVQDAALDGNESQMGWNDVDDLLVHPRGEILFSDFSNIDIRKLKYHFEYELMGTPPVGSEGSQTLTFTLKDGVGDNVVYEVPLTVLTPNTAPSVSTIPDISETFTTGFSTEIPLFDYFSDSESADTELTYEVVTVSDATVLSTSEISSGTGILKLTVSNAGETNVTVKAIDERGEEVSTTFKVTIAKASAEIVVTYDASTEEDGTSKSVTVSTSPSDLNYLITYNGLSDLPITAGTYAVVVTIDERNYKGSNTSDFVILTANTSPVVSTIPDVFETYNPSGTIQVSLFDYFSDAESSDSELTYELLSISDESVVSAMDIVSTDGLLNLSIKKAGTTTITVKALDERGLFATSSFEATINKATAAITFGELEFINDGEAKVVSVTTDPADLGFTLTYNELTTAPSAVGAYSVKVVINDANYEGEASIEMTILNIAPSDIALSVLSIFENAGSDVELGTLSVTDENGVDTHTFVLADGVNDNEVFEIAGTRLKIKSSLNYEVKSTYQVSIKVLDEYDASYSKTFQIEVLDVNEVPTIDGLDEVQVVKNLGSLTLDITGLSAGEESSQTISLSAVTSGVIGAASISLNSDNTSATLTFETTLDQEGSGNIQVTVQDNGGTANSGIDSKTIDIPFVVVSPNITVTSGSNCGEGSVALGASGADGYAWYTSPLGGSAFDQGADITVSLTESTTYYVAGVFAGDESKLRVPVDAIVFEALDAPIITNNDNVMSVPEVTGLTYQWFRDGIEVNGAMSNAFAADESGNYTVLITNENGCTATSAAEEVIVTGIEDELNRIEVIVYPVPADNFVTLKFDELLKKGTTIKLIENSGRVLSVNVLSNNATSVNINVSDLLSGVHTILVRDGIKFARKRIIINR